MGKHPSYSSIYSIGLLELKTLKAYIKIHLKDGFIWPFKYLVGTPLFFDKKSDRSLQLYVDYQGLNNLTIKNRYLLLFISKSLDRFGHAKQFIELDLTNAYYQIRIREGDEWKNTFRTRYDHFKY